MAHVASHGYGKEKKAIELAQLYQDFGTLVNLTLSTLPDPNISMVELLSYTKKFGMDFANVLKQHYLSNSESNKIGVCSLLPSKEFLFILFSIP